MRSSSVAVRTHQLVFGTVIFLASESMLFGALLAAYYYLRGSTQPWPPTGTSLDYPGMALGTGLLGYASITMFFAQKAAEKNRWAAARAMLVVTMLAALGFMYLEINDWYDGNLWVSHSAYDTLYFVMTGTHLAHVAAGIALMVALSLFLRTRAYTREHHAGVEAIAYYWHFVFAIWLLLYSSIFLVK